MPPFVSLIHCFFECIVCFEPVICMGVVAREALIAGKAENRSADAVPLAFGQGDGERGGIVGHGLVVNCANPTPSGTDPRPLTHKSF